MTTFKVNNELDSNGTSFHGVTIIADPGKLTRMLGTSDMTDDHKVSKSWTCSYKGNVFTIYDWKETSLYSSRLPSPDYFWSQREVEVHVGSRTTKENEVEFAKVVLDSLSGKIPPPAIKNPFEEESFYEAESLDP